MKDYSKSILIAGAIAAGAAVTVGIFRNSNLDRQNHSQNPLVVSARPRPDTTPAAPPSIERTDPPPASRAVPQEQTAAGLPRTSLTFGDRFGSADNPPAFQRFAEWCRRYQAALSDEERASLEVEGRRLAQLRRAELTTLIREQPGLAIDLSVPFDVRQALPRSIQDLLEENVSGTGTLAVFGALAEPGKEAEVVPVFRTALFDEQEYDAFVYGRRLGEPTRRNIPLNGIALGRLLALSENPLRVLSAAEAGRSGVATEPVCAISGQPAAMNNTPTTAEAGGRKIRLCGLGHADEMNAKLIHAEAAGGGSSGEIGGDDVQASAYTEGIKRLLVIRVDFPDMAGDPFATNIGVSLISGLNDFYSESSYGRAGFHLNGQGSAITPTLHLTNRASYYGTNNNYTALQNDARAAASAAGYNVANYDFDLTCFGPVPGWSWAGLGWIGAKGVWLRNYFTTGVAGHELGHNYGLNHANFWDTGGTNVIGNIGSSVEYGDSFDTMGSASAGANHFSARYKSYLNWLRTGEVQTVTSSGTYRIYAHDDTNASGIRALKVARNSNTNYWIEFRQKFTGNIWMMNGAGLRWAGNGNQRSDLLDTTPGSANGKNDSPLVVGRTFSDVAAGIHITTLRKAGTLPEALDLVVNLGTFPSNQRPALSVGANSTGVAISSPVTLTATASDPDGDSLAYHWDFGDGTFGTNGSIASKSWSAAGVYRVQCTATDMKGGTARDSVIVSVGSPATYSIAGTVTAGGAPVAGARVFVSSSRMAYTDSDGTYSIVGLSPSSYTVNVILDSYSFVPSGFSNPVNVGPSASGVAFTTSGFVTVALTGPANNSTFVNPSSVTLTATASPSSGHSLTKVEFYRGATKLGEDTTSPYSYSWASPDFGSHSLTAVATDSGGWSAASAPITVVINSGGPVITGQPQSVAVTAGATASFLVTATGSGLNYLWRGNGANIPGGTNASLSLVDVQLSQAGSYQVVVSNTGGAVTSSVVSLTVLQAPFITAHPRSQTVTAGSDVTLTSAAIGLAPLSFQWHKNGGPIAGATASSLSFTPITPGDAADYAVVVSNSAGAATSSVATIAVHCMVTLSATGASFTTAGGNGSVSINAYSACGWTVANAPAWITLTSPSSGSGNAVVTYVVSTNTSGSIRSATLDIGGSSYQITELPFVASKGVFSGLFYETNQVEHQRAGYFNLALTYTGSYSAALLTRGWKLKAKGKFDPTGCATNQIVAPDGTRYTVTWAIALDGSDTISGEVSAGGWTSSLLGDRLVFNAKTNPAPQAGRYTFVVLGIPGQPDVPGGDGHGTVVVATKGVATLSGWLGDRTRFVARPPLSRLGNSPVYSALYSGRGAVLGWMVFRDRPTTDFDAVLSWTRPSLPGVLYPGGFVSESAMIGSRFEATPANVPLLELVNPAIRFEGGNLGSSITNALVVSGGRFINVYLNALSLNVTRSSGRFNGSVAAPDSVRSLPFRGVVLQKAGIGCGYFVGTNQTGRVTLESTGSAGVLQQAQDWFLPGN